MTASGAIPVRIMAQILAGRFARGEESVYRLPRGCNRGRDTPCGSRARVPFAGRTRNWGLRPPPFRSASAVFLFEIERPQPGPRMRVARS